MTEIEFKNEIENAKRAAELDVAQNYDPLTGLKKRDFEKDYEDYIKWIVMD